jgi:hypothetical protein
MRLFIAALVLSLAGPGASAQMCQQGKDSFARCKPCSEIANITFAYNKVGALNCAYGCATPCSVIPKATIDPSERASAQDDPLRGLDPLSLAPSAACPGKEVPRLLLNYYAFDIGDAQIRAMAKVSPPAAWFVTVLRDQQEIPPVALEEGETIDESIITAENIDLLLEGLDDDVSHAAVSPPLEGDVSFVTNTRVHRLPNGHRVFVVESRVLDHPTGATLATPYPRFAVEMERIAGQTRKVGGAEGNDATLWRVVSWGSPERYF